MAFGSSRAPTDPTPETEVAECYTTYSLGTSYYKRGCRLRWDDPIVQAHRDFWRMVALPVPKAKNGLRLG